MKEREREREREREKKTTRQVSHHKEWIATAAPLPGCTMSIDTTTAQPDLVGRLMSWWFAVIDREMHGCITDLPGLRIGIIGIALRGLRGCYPVKKKMKKMMMIMMMRVESRDQFRIWKKAERKGGKRTVT